MERDSNPRWGRGLGPTAAGDVTGCGQGITTIITTLAVGLQSTIAVNMSYTLIKRKREQQRGQKQSFGSPSHVHLVPKERGIERARM
jgi:hypothetical protein